MHFGWREHAKHCQEAWLGQTLLGCLGVWPWAKQILVLRRMEGFKDPWESAVFKGRLLAPDRALQDYGIASGDMIITVRRVLVPEGVLRTYTCLSLPCSKPAA